MVDLIRRPARRRLALPLVALRNPARSGFGVNISPLFWGERGAVDAPGTGAAGGVDQGHHKSGMTHVTTATAKLVIGLSLASRAGL